MKYKTVTEQGNPVSDESREKRQIP